MHIDHFGREVLIDKDHPLAVAQRVADAARAASDVPRTERTAVPSAEPTATVVRARDDAPTTAPSNTTRRRGRR